MTILEAAPAPYLKPLPEVRPENKPFFDALKNHQFVVPRCDDCGDYNWVPYPACRSCLSWPVKRSPTQSACSASRRSTASNLTRRARLSSNQRAGRAATLVQGKLRRAGRPERVALLIGGSDVREP